MNDVNKHIINKQSLNYFNNKTIDNNNNNDNDNDKKIKIDCTIINEDTHQIILHHTIEDTIFYEKQVIN